MGTTDVIADVSSPFLYPKMGGNRLGADTWGAAIGRGRRTWIAIRGSPPEAITC